MVIANIKHYVDGLLDAKYRGSVHVEKISRDTGINSVFVRDALFVLRDTFPGDYRVYRFDGKIAIDKNDGRIGRTVFSFSRSNSLARLACLGPATGVAIWYFKDLLLGRPFEMWGFAVMLPLAYIGEWLNTRFRKCREERSNSWEA